MESAKATSYHDLLNSFQRAETSNQTPRNKKLVYKPKNTANRRSNK